MHQFSFSDFELKNNLIFLTCNINGRDRNFLLDTGSHKVVLNSKYQDSSSYENFSDKKLKGTTGTISEVGIMRINTLVCGNIKECNVSALIMDLAHIEKTLNTEVYGLIGYEFLKEYNVYLDYQRRKIGLWNEEKIETYLNNKVHRGYKFKMKGHLPIIQCQVGHSTYQTVLDTGANSNLFDADLLNKLKDNMAFEKHEKIVGANQDLTESSYLVGKIKTTEIDGLGKFYKMSTVFSDVSHLNQSSTVKIDGIVGYPLLSQATFIISFTQNILFVVDR